MANNASGMCCGTAQNSYKTIESMTFILLTGTRINTADPDAEEQFAHAESELAKGLIDIQSESTPITRPSGLKNSQEVQHQKYYGLPYGGVLTKMLLEDLPAPHSRLGRHARFHRRSSLKRSGTTNTA